MTNGLCVNLCVGCVLQTLNYSKYTERDINLREVWKVLLKLNYWILSEFNCTVSLALCFDISIGIFFIDQCEMKWCIQSQFTLWIWVRYIALFKLTVTCYTECQADERISDILGVRPWLRLFWNTAYNRQMNQREQHVSSPIH